MTLKNEDIVLTEEQLEKIMRNREKLESEGFKIEDRGEYIVITFPDGKQYEYRKPVITGETREISLPREGKRYKARIKRIVIEEIYKLYDEVGINPEKLMNRCMENGDPREQYKCLRRLTRIGYLIIFEVPELGIEGWDIIPFSVHPNSRLRRLSASYKKFYVEQEIWVMLDDKGRLRITTPPEE